jgi:hypothetical protein
MLLAEPGLGQLDFVVCQLLRMKDLRQGSKI